MSPLNFPALRKERRFPNGFQKLSGIIFARRRAVRTLFMQSLAAQQIVEEMNAHMTQSGIPIDRWYVGVAADWQQRLFVTHRLPQPYRWFICRNALNHRDAQAIALAYHKAGSTGHLGRADETAVFVYAYAITPQTVQ